MASKKRGYSQAQILECLEGEDDDGLPDIEIEEDCEDDDDIVETEEVRYHQVDDIVETEEVRYHQVDVLVDDGVSFPDPLP
jgi:hypothetical protein